MSRARARELAVTFLERGDATGWFDALYAEAAGNVQAIPWADLAANPHLVEWLKKTDVRAAGQCALIVGCGLGDDAEMLATRGFSVTAFDVSPEAIRWCHARYPDSRVHYLSADLFELPVEWNRAFDLIVEVNTLQVLPADMRPRAMGAIADCVADGGQLFVAARGRESNDPPGEMPWPLMREELNHFVSAGLKQVMFEDLLDQEVPPVRRFCAEYRR